MLQRNEMLKMSEANIRASLASVQKSMEWLSKINRQIYRKYFRKK